jgi:O-antigen/teichoic acid export membrane protein
MKSSIYGVIAQLAQAMQAIILPPMLIRQLGVDSYASNILIYTLMGLLYAISPLGTGFILKRRLPKMVNKKKVNNLFYNQLWIQFISLFLVLLIFTFFSLQLNSPAQIQYFGFSISSYSLLVIFLYQISLLVYSLAIDFYRSQNRLDLYALACIFNIILFISIVSTCLIFNVETNVISILLANIVSYSITCSILIYNIIKKIGFTLKIPALCAVLVDFKLGFPILIISLLEIIIGNIDKYIIVYYLGKTELGYYSPVIALASFSKIISYGVNNALVPKLSQLNAGKDLAQLSNEIFSSIKLVMLFQIPFMTGCFLLDEQIINIYVGQNISSHSGYLLFPISIYVFLSGVLMMMNNIYFISNENSKLLISYISSTTLIVLFCVFFLSVHKSLASIVLSLICSQLVVIIVSFRRKFDLILNLGFNYIYSLFFATLGMSFYIIFMNKILSYPITIKSFSLIFLGACIVYLYILYKLLNNKLIGYFSSS